MKPRPSALEHTLRLLLRMYPRAFRQEFGEAWMEVALHRLTQLRRAGRPWPRVALMAFLLKDAVTGLPAARRGTGTHESTARDRSLHEEDGAVHLLELVVRDVRFGVRTLSRRPLFAAIAVGTLGLGIGAATTLFSAVETVLLRPLPYERPEELTTVFETFPEWKKMPQLAAGWDRVYLAWPDYVRWRDGQSMFQDVAIYGVTAMTLTDLGTPQRAITGLASTSLFSVLGVQPELGRTFLPGEDGPAAAKVALVSRAFWLEHFGGDPHALGSSFTLNGNAFTVVGVLPASFRLRRLGIFGGTGTPAIWIPVGADGGQLRAGQHSYDGIARLRPGVSRAQALPETANLLRGDEPPSEMGARLTSRIEEETAGYGRPLYLLLGASLVLLLIACGNVAMLLLSESTNRRQEMATRLAVGASRVQLFRQLLVESVLLGGMGSGVGIALAVGGTRFATRLAPPIPRFDGVGVDATVLGFAVGIGVLTGLVFGLVPWVGVLRGGTEGALHGVSRGGEGRTPFLQRAVIALEVGLTVVVLVPGVLLARSLDRLFSADPGFDPGGLAEVDVQLPSYLHPDAEERLQVLTHMRVALEAVPGVASVTGTSSVPFGGFANALSFGIVDAPDPEGVSRHASHRSVLPEYFRTMGIPLLTGRVLTEDDESEGRKVAVISQEMARRFWPGTSPLGARLDFGDTLTVVGVVGDVRHESMDAKPLPTFYTPLSLAGDAGLTFVVRTSGDVTALLPTLRLAVWSVDGGAPVLRAASVTSLIAGSARGERFRTVILMIFGICGALLAGGGVYGVTARGAARRSREIGVRVALGARRARLVTMVVRSSLEPGLIGVALGLFGALASSRLLQGLLFEVGSVDPVTYGAVAVATVILSVLASLLPAIKASSISPMEVLRGE